MAQLNYKIGHSDDGGIFIGKNIKSAFHEHHFIAIILSFKEKFFISEESGQSSHYEVALIPKDVSYKLSTGSENYTVFIHVDPYSEIGLLLAQSGDQILRSERSNFAAVLNELHEWFLDPKSSNHQVQHFLQTVASQFLKKETQKRKVDSRVLQCIEFIKTSEIEDMNLEKAADFVSLSSGRLYHLFKQETGITFRQFIQHRKLVQSMISLNKGHNFTEASHLGGFHDQPHFIKVFKKYFGIKPSKIKK